MSYILEALADSEQARLQIAAAPKYSLLPAVGEELPQQRRWPYVLAGALLVNAAVLQFWLRPALPGSVASFKAPAALQVAETRAAAPESAFARPNAIEKPAADVAEVISREIRQPQSRPEEINDRRALRAAAPVDSVPKVAPMIRTDDVAPIRIPRMPAKFAAKQSAEAVVATEATPSPVPRPAPKVAAKRNTEPVVAAEATPSPSSTSPSPVQAGSTAQIPASLQQEMPALTVAGFIRDEGSSSMVIVNDRLVREGDEVAPGVKLEKILNDSLVFNYKGYRFTR